MLVIGLAALVAAAEPGEAIAVEPSPALAALVSASEAGDTCAVVLWVREHGAVALADVPTRELWSAYQTYASNRYRGPPTHHPCVAIGAEEWYALLSELDARELSFVTCHLHAGLHWHRAMAASRLLTERPLGVAGADPARPASQLRRDDLSAALADAVARAEALERVGCGRLDGGGSYPLRDHFDVGGRGRWDVVPEVVAE